MSELLKYQLDSKSRSQYIIIRKALKNCIFGLEIGCSELWVVKKGLQMVKNPFATFSIDLWHVKINPSQNQGLRTSLERPYNELLNVCFSFILNSSYI